jgi:hypothetical protein
MDWRPATIGEVAAIVQEHLRRCDGEQRSMFERYSVEPYFAPIVRYGQSDQVVVVARRGNEVMYWEDVEEGFNVSEVRADGQIAHHWCNQDELRHVLTEWGS